MAAKLRDAGTQVIILILLIGGVALGMWLGIPWGYCVLAILLSAVASIPLIVLMSARFPVHRTCRQQCKTVAELEAQFLVHDDGFETAPSLFSFRREDWLPLLAQMKEGDEFWTFCSPPRTWEHLCGRAGIVLVRNGKSVAHIITAMN